MACNEAEGRKGIKMPFSASHLLVVIANTNANTKICVPVLMVLDERFEDRIYITPFD
jgi:hypothetical protein